MVERKEDRKEWFKKQPTAKVKPAMNRRKEGHDYAGRCAYMVTMCTNGRRPLFGTLRNSDSSHAMPWIEPSELGLIVLDWWSRIAIEQPLVKNIAFQLMPDHIHGIIFVTESLPRHFGHLLSRFKAKTSAAYHELTHETISLWEMGYNDKILITKGQMKRWANYLLDNPRRLWIKRNHPEWFTVRRGIIIDGTPVSVMGNHLLLSHPDKKAVQFSRRMMDDDIDKACRQYLSLARNGVVLVSPCISPGERSIMKRAFEAGFPLIILLENGFSPMQKPAGRQFDACANGHLLLVSPWEHHNEKRKITREQCMELNRLASAICNPCDMSL